MQPKLLQQRRAGVLLHPTSLPGEQNTGALGPDAERFVQFAAEAGFSLWQMLPIGPTHDDGSPYQALSLYAGNPRLISLERLVEAGWLRHCEPAPGMERVAAYRAAKLAEARQGFLASASADDRTEYEAFQARSAAWLEDYVLFCALRREHGHRAWIEWTPELRDREPKALANARARLASELEQYRFEQFLFDRQWRALKAAANARGVWLFGDMPIFVAHDSADVWAHREYFDLNEDGSPRTVAGVPPDYFSATGQYWGNPHYDWGRMRADGFRWWIDRVRAELDRFDLLRIDHFRGFEAYWEIPAGAPTAVEGRWVQAPGAELFQALREALGELPLVAEDLGVITPAVTALREQFGLPGMKILQFAFDSDAQNPYLPHHHRADFVVYTGTHDNDTTCGWFEHLSDAQRTRVLDYLGARAEDMPWALIRCAFMSVARTAVVPMQDLLALGSEHRMNTPGTAQGNWRWRFDWSQVPEGLAARVRHMLELYGRVA